MISLLQGTLAYRDGNVLTVDVQGVGYEVIVSDHVLQQVQPIGSAIRVFIFTDVRENAIQLVGFREPSERALFLLLRKVKGVGTKLSLTIVSALRAEVLLSSIGRGDIEMLKRIPGVGKKTAERLVVELREQVGEFVKELTPLTSHLELSEYVPKLGAQWNGLPTECVDAALALEKLGFTPERAELAVITAFKQSGSVVADAGELVKRALSCLV